MVSAFLVSLSYFFGSVKQFCPNCLIQKLRETIRPKETPSNKDLEEHANNLKPIFTYQNCNSQQLSSVFLEGNPSNPIK